MNTIKRLMLPSLLAFFCAPLQAQSLNLDSIYGLLMRVATAPSEVAYHGTVKSEFVNSSGTRTVLVNIVHQRDGQDRVTILQPSRDAGRVFVRNRSGANEHGTNRPLSLGLSGVKNRVGGDLELLLANYSLSAFEGGKIVGRATYRVEILPKYPDRKSKQLWVDQKTGIVLKSVVRHPVGGLVVTTEFTSITLTPNTWTLPETGMKTLKLPSQEVGVDSGTKWKGVIEKTELSTLSAIEKKEHFSLLSPSYLPPGFVMEEVRDFPSPMDSRARVVHILYSDGLSSISLFLQQEEPFWPDRVRSFLFGGRRHDHHHPDDHGVAVVEGARGGTRYVLVSDVATETLQKMADSLSPIN